MQPSDERVWMVVREKNRAWLRPWEAAEPPGRHVRPISFRALVRLDRRQWRTRRAVPMVIQYEGYLVGRVAIAGIEWGSARTGALGYWIDEQFAGRGIVPRAVALLAEYGFSLGLHRLEIAVRPENEASVRVAQKLGFRDEGLRRRYLYIDGDWRDHRVFAMLSEDKRTGEFWRCSD